MKASSLFSWILRGRGGEPDPSSSLSTTHRKGRIHGLEGKKEAEGNGDEELGVTEELLEFLKGFTVEVFKQFPISDRQDDGDGMESSNPNVRKDLSKWQERHATLILTTAKEIARLRYILCPRHLKENEFWMVYFSLVKNYTFQYEIRAIQKEKLRRMESEHEKSRGSVGFEEVEMTDAKQMT
ncbi:hypothetical protein ZOSMA_80G00040 [Zostera marina]|uniref:BSD domain-containing protein n=1 Tax=Zostera marina TaxID=29655 RepID=A0A0K9NM96_ZOSMR|nr:hypothetical protein ZOSMA_80G00040 [Zostera marina]